MSKAAKVFDQTYYPYENGYPESFSGSIIKELKHNLWVVTQIPPLHKIGGKNYWKNLKESLNIVMNFNQSVQ